MVVVGVRVATDSGRLIDTGCDRTIPCVAVCCSVLQCVAVCCGVLQSAAECCRVLQSAAACCSVLQFDAVCCSVTADLLLFIGYHVPGPLTRS